ncbi:hypothetical protein SAMN04487824_12721, partial [Parafannyhessea umbonata]
MTGTIGAFGRSLAKTYDQTSTSPNAEMANSMPGAALDTTTDHERRHLVI